MSEELTYPVARRIYVTKDMAQQLADYKFARRINSEVEAIRELLAIGLETARQRKAQGALALIEQAMQLLSAAKGTIEAPEPPDLAALAYKLIKSQLPMMRPPVVPEQAAELRAKPVSPRVVPPGPSADSERLKQLLALEPFLDMFQFDAGEIDIPADVMKAALQRHIDEAKARLAS